MLVTCGGCGIKFDRHTEPSEYISSKWYHKRCSEKKKKYQELSAYICKTFNLKRIGPMNATLIKKYTEKNDFTLDGILNALKYFYEVKASKKDNSEERIGIVPYVYEEAQKYYSIRQYKQDRAGASLEKSNKKPEKEILVDMKKMEEQKSDKKNSEPTGLFDLDSLFEE